MAHCLTRGSLSTICTPHARQIDIGQDMLWQAVNECICCLESLVKKSMHVSIMHNLSYTTAQQSSIRA